MLTHWPAFRPDWLKSRIDRISRVVVKLNIEPVAYNGRYSSFGFWLNSTGKVAVEYQTLTGKREEQVDDDKAELPNSIALFSNKGIVTPLI